MATTTTSTYVNPNDAILKAATTKDYTPSADQIALWVSSFVPGATAEYNAYLDALKKAAELYYDTNPAEAQKIDSIQKAFNEWSKYNTITSVSSSKKFDQIAEQVNTIKKSLADATKTINDVVDNYNNAVTNTSAKGTLTTNAAKAQTAYDTAYTALYGAAKSNFSADNAASSSLLGKYNVANTALETAKANLADVQGKTAGLTTAVQTAQGNADKAKTAYDAAAAASTKANTDLKTATDALTTAKANLAAAQDPKKIASLTTAVKTAQATADKAKAAYDAAVAAATKANTGLNTATSALGTAQANLAANKDPKKTASLTAAVKTAQATADKAKAAYDAAAAATTKANTDLNTATSALGTAQANLADVQGKTASLTTAVQTAQATADKAKAAYDAAAAATTKANTDLTTATKALNTAQANLAADSNYKKINSLTAAVQTAQATADKAKTAYDAGAAIFTKADTDFKTATGALNTAKDSLTTAKTDLGKTYYSSIDSYNANILEPYKAFIAGDTQTDDEKIATALDFYKANGYIDPTWAANNPTLVGKLTTQTEAYNQKKAQDEYAATYTTATDLAGALKDYAEKGLIVDSQKNPDLYYQAMDSIAKGIDTPAKLEASKSASTTGTTAGIGTTTGTGTTGTGTTGTGTTGTGTTGITGITGTTGTSTADIINFLNTVKGQDTGGLDLNGLISYLTSGKQAEVTTPAVNTTSTPTTTTPVNTPVVPAVKKEQVQGNVQINLPTAYNTRSFVQDLAARQAQLHPNTYATGQFDPFYSGYLSSAGTSPQTPSAMGPGGTFANGPGYVTPSTVGLGFQNAYNPSNTTGAAAGGYMDAQVINQQNQALQQPNNQTLGLGAIPNMSQYRDYQNNPGITSSTQIGDDGNVGGVPVPGQTNPIW